MPPSSRQYRAILLAVFVLGTVSALAVAQEPRAPSALIADNVVAGGPADFMEVRHVVLAGSNFEIGRALAWLAKEHYGSGPQRAQDPVRARAQRRFVEQTFPALAERMRGAAAFWGVPYESDEVDLSGIADPAARPGCSVVYFPPDSTAAGTGVLSRNYDFSTGTLFGRVPPPGTRPCTARPMVLELHPEDGLSSLAIGAYDVFAGVLDGMNSSGLAVALLAVDEQSQAGAIETEGPPQVGLGVLTMLRLLLDTCHDVEEAKLALLTTKQNYLIPTHAIVCDAAGRSFVWERSFGGNFDYVLDGDGTPQIVTNYALHRHPDLAELPVEASPLGAFHRARKLADCIAAHADLLTLEDVVAANAEVACTPDKQPLVPGRAVHRTLWHSLYVPEEQTLAVDFYLGEEIVPGAAGPSELRRSGYLEFTLPECAARAPR